SPAGSAGCVSRRGSSRARARRGSRSRPPTAGAARSSRHRRLTSAAPTATSYARLEREEAMAERLVGAARHAALREVHGWSEVDDRDAIRKSYQFSDFSEAWGLLPR